MKTQRIWSIIILMLLGCINLFSIEYADTKGRDFWFTFLPNSHKDASTTSSDSLYIFISADEVSTGTIEYYDRDGYFYKQTFTISRPNSLYALKLQYYNYELWGYKTENREGIRYQSEMISKMAFHITSDNEITVYAHSQAKQTSDAFLVLPTDVLDKDYIVASYNSDGKRTGTGGSGPTPSQFAVVSTENGTVVTITPKNDTQYNSTLPVTMVLDKGQVYLVQAKVTYQDANLDLTCSEIHASKPVAVFGGHQKCLVPYSSSFSAGSRDYLMEQMPPISVLGKDAFITPLKQPSRTNTTYNDVYRILAVSDSTVLFLNNIKVATINKGEYYQDYITTTATVKSNNSFMLVKYKKTSDLSGGFYNGDPFMLVVPPKEQFMRSYKTINVQAWEDGSKVYTEQYITIVIPTAGIPSFRLDGNSVSAATFSPIPNSTYSYANLSVGDGVHETEADSTFGIFIYGYGTANSFGYTGGMSYRPMDYQPPQISVVDSCFQIKGLIYDTLSSDKGIMLYESPASQNKNCIVTFHTLSADSKTIRFTAKLADRRQDGSFTVNATDSVGQTNSKTYEIKGYTIAVNGLEMKDTLLFFKANQRTGQIKCFDIPVHNYGKFDQILNFYRLNRSSLSTIVPSLPIMLKPGEVDTITICFIQVYDSIFTDTLSIFNDCGELLGIARFRIISGDDKKPPVFSFIGDSCGQNLSYFISDSATWDSGIESIKINEKKNCNINIQQPDAFHAKIEISIIKPDEDMSFSIVVTDSSGNKITLSDTIYGGKVSIYGVFDTSSQVKMLNFKERYISSTAMDSIVLYNSGASDLTIKYIILAKNVSFSIPQSQFPLTIKANDSTKIYIMFHPTNSDAAGYIDTLIINSFCINQSLILRGFGKALEYGSISDCGINLTLRAAKSGSSFFVSGVYPNPAANNFTISFNIPTQSDVGLTIYNYTGKAMKIFHFEHLKEGLYERNIPIEDFPSGAYFLRLQCGNENVFRSFIKP